MDNIQPESKPEPEPIILGSSQSASDAPKSTIKFLCSYRGKILPRYPDGKLRYLGGQTRVLAVDRTIQFSELLSKLEELCGSSVRHLRCQLPAEDLDALVSITSDEDLANLIEEYDRVMSPPLKIRAFLSPPRSLNKLSAHPSMSLSKSASSSSSSSASSSSSSSCQSPTGGGSGFCSGRSSIAAAAPVVDRCVHQMSPMTAYPVGVEKSSVRNIPLPRYGYHAQGNTGNVYLIHNGNHWQ
ncbi:protein PAL OF QUIRKY-like [Gastrolobium bilobum]|uniref:protein PAL OF QUIRKY-like n=1 Tax=Gastrolobium bilobum TaxID=150636 RepID=UPI002AB21F23|nr:protein PAL OF QUIRKY-like [Gastrolobium bilobum]